MWVILKRDFFAGGHLYKANTSGTEVNDKFKDQLPKDAVVISEQLPIPAATASVRMTAKALSELSEEDKPLPPPTAKTGFMAEKLSTKKVDDK